MGSGPKDKDILARLPDIFYEQLLRDIPATTWSRVLASDLIAKKTILEGFSLQPEKFSRSINQPVIIKRFRRAIQANPVFFDKVLSEWKEEQPAIFSYLSMLNSDFITQNLWKIRDLLGPARLCIGLFSLGFRILQRAEDVIDQNEFWVEAQDAALFDILVPTLAVWSEFIENHPDLSQEFLAGEEGGGFIFDIEAGQSEQNKGPVPEPKEPFKKVEKKLQKTQSDLTRAGEQLNSLRSENDDLRKKLKEFEFEFEKRLDNEIHRMRKKWFERYQDLDRKEAAKEVERLESLLQRTRRALELQNKADEEYGLVSEIRQKMLEIDLSLNQIETVYAASLVVHKEVEKVKDALLREKNRLLNLPGIGRVIGSRREGGGEIIARINLLEPVPANLPKISSLLKMADGLAEIGFVSDPAPVENAARNKKRQIMERLYSQFKPGKKDRAQAPRFIEDLVGSGQSRKYDLFVDGYNVLLRVFGGDENYSRMGFTQFREQFIDALAAGSRSFAKVWLVFDGVEDSRDFQANVEIIYTDKTKRSADEVIIEGISARKDRKILLVTEDEEIISSVHDRIFALINVVDFYMFLFE